MFSLLKPVDTVLRGDLRLQERSAAGRVEFPMLQVVVLSVLLAAVYGAAIGSFAAIAGRDGDGWMQLIASAVKAPLLFYLTLLVTFPSLYVFNALMGSRLDMLSVLRLLVAAITVMVAILASLGPIIVFFSFSTPSGYPGYRFILLMIVVLSAGAGLLGLHYLLRMLNQFSRPTNDAGIDGKIHQRPAPQSESAPLPSTGDPGSPRSSVEVEIVDADAVPATLGSGTLQPVTPHSVPAGQAIRSSSPALSIFRVWVLVFAIVGAQMSWVLRPFIGSPDKEFTWFRERSGNFFQSVYHLVHDILSGQ